MQGNVVSAIEQGAICLSFLVAAGNETLVISFQRCTQLTTDEMPVIPQLIEAKKFSPLWVG